MHHLPRNYHAPARIELDSTALKVDQQPALKHEEELIVAVVLVPVKLASDDSEPHHAVVDPHQSLVEPFLPATGDHRRNVNDFEAAALDTGVDVVPHGLRFTAKCQLVSTDCQELPATLDHFAGTRDNQRE